MPSYRNLRNLGLGVAAAIPLSLAASHQAHAVPYAYASNVDAGFTISVAPGSGGSYTAVQDTAVFTTNNSITSSYFSTPAPTLVSTTGNTVSDAAQVQVPGAGVAENFFGQAYKAAAVNSLRADSLDGAFSGGGGNVAETRLVTGPVGASTSGFGKLNSTNTSAIGISVGAGTVLRVTFNVTPGLEASTSALIGESATSTIASSVSITRLDGTTVFSFVPTGNQAGDVTGGVATSDPFSLNRTISSTSGTPADNTFFPGTGTFTATTGPLNAGFYNIVIGQSSTVNATIGAPTATPEPASLAVLGAGLVGLGFLRRKKTS
jgi:hypothetical protein